MSATVVKEFCRAYGINEKSENLIDEIFEALTGGKKYRKAYRVKPKRAKVKATVPNSGARTPDS